MRFALARLLNEYVKENQVFDQLGHYDSVCKKSYGLPTNDDDESILLFFQHHQRPFDGVRKGCRYISFSYRK